MTQTGGLATRKPIHARTIVLLPPSLLQFAPRCCSALSKVYFLYLAYHLVARSSGSYCSSRTCPLKRNPRGSTNVRVDYRHSYLGIDARAFLFKEDTSSRTALKLLISARVSRMTECHSFSTCRANDVNARIYVSGGTKVAQRLCQRLDVLANEPFRLRKAGSGRSSLTRQQNYGRLNCLHCFSPVCRSFPYLDSSD